MADTKPKKPEPIVATGDIDIILPPKPARDGSGNSKYPFADLEIGKFFSVKNKDRRSMASAIANANKRYRSELKDETGKVVNTVQDREFYALDVNADLAKKLKGTPHEGAQVLVVRSR